MHGSIVDQVVHLVYVPQTRLYEPDTPLPDAESHDTPDVVTFFEFLSNAHSAHKANQELHEPWKLGPLFESILEMPRAISLETTLFASLHAPEFDQLLDEVQGLGIFPNPSASVNLFRARKPFSEQLWSMLRTERQTPVSFFITRQGLCGLCMPGARIGDQVAVLFREAPGWKEVPFVIRENGNVTHAMVYVAWVSKSWRDLCEQHGALHTCQKASRLAQLAQLGRLDRFY